MAGDSLKASSSLEHLWRMSLHCWIEQQPLRGSRSGGSRETARLKLRPEPKHQDVLIVIGVELVGRAVNELILRANEEVSSRLIQDPDAQGVILIVSGVADRHRRIVCNRVVAMAFDSNVWPSVVCHIKA